MVLQINERLLKYGAKGEIDAVKKALDQDVDPNWENKKYDVSK